MPGGPPLRSEPCNPSWGRPEPCPARLSHPGTPAAALVLPCVRDRRRGRCRAGPRCVLNRAIHHGAARNRAPRALAIPAPRRRLWFSLALVHRVLVWLRGFPFSFSRVGSGCRRGLPKARPRPGPYAAPEKRKKETHYTKKTHWQKPLPWRNMCPHIKQPLARGGPQYSNPKTENQNRHGGAGRTPTYPKTGRHRNRAGRRQPP